VSVSQVIVCGDMNCAVKSSLCAGLLGAAARGDEAQTCLLERCIGAAGNFRSDFKVRVSSIAGKLVYGSFIPLELFLYLSLNVACFFLLLFFLFVVLLSFGRRVAVGGVDDGETGSVRPATGDLNKLGVLLYAISPRPFFLGYDLESVVLSLI
jgi:hypothetical protein